MRNNALLTVIIGISIGLAVIFSFSTMLQMAFTPMIAHLNQIQANERVIISNVQSLNDKIQALESKLGNPGQAPAAPQENFDQVYTIDVGNSPVNGNKNAPITIVQFTDLQCPFCARFYPPLKEVLNAYPDKVKIVLKNFPLSFHPNARPAAKLALAANMQGKYFEIIDLLLSNAADVSDAKVKEYAKTLNLNYDQLMKNLKANDSEFEKIITEDIALGEKVNVEGTPTFYINGKKTRSRDFNAYKAEIDQILAGK